MVFNCYCAKEPQDSQIVSFEVIGNVALKNFLAWFIVSILLCSSMPISQKRKIEDRLTIWQS